MFGNFDFSLLDDPDFKEDSVREELILPLLKKLGYSASGNNRIIRSKPLAHPYSYIGTTKYRIYIIPDYLLKVEDSHSWILDAKAPKEEILKGRNAEQAYSYAIHPDVRAFRYALCNGRKLVIFDVNRIEPQLVINVDELEDRFEEVERLLSPLAFTKPHLLDFKPDFGLHMLKLGAQQNKEIHFIPIGINMISRVEDGLYTACSYIEAGGLQFSGSFDFDSERFEELMQALPNDKEQMARITLKKQPYSIAFAFPWEDELENKVIPYPNTELFMGGIPEVCMLAKVRTAVYSNADEYYAPLWVEKFYAFDIE